MKGMKKKTRKMKISLSTPSDQSKPSPKRIFPGGNRIFGQILDTQGMEDEPMEYPEPPPDYVSDIGTPMEFFQAPENEGAEQWNFWSQEVDGKLNQLHQWIEQLLVKN